MKGKKIKPLSEWEWDLTWSSLRYFCGRYTIASAMTRWIPVDTYENSGSTRTSVYEEYIKQIKEHEPK